jgi:hypothetical protein
MAAQKSKKSLAKSTKKSSKSGLKILIIGIIVFYFIAGLVIWGAYQNNKPNYRDLQAAYNQLNIPADWQLVSESSNKGLWGMFCVNGELNTSPCPQKTIQWNLPKDSALDEIKAISPVTLSEVENLCDNGICRSVYKDVDGIYYIYLKDTSNPAKTIITLILGNENAFGI